MFAVAADVAPTLGHPAEQIAEVSEAVVPVPAVTKHEVELQLRWDMSHHSQSLNHPFSRCWS